MTANEVYTDGTEQGTVVLNSTDLSTDWIADNISGLYPEVASMIRWGQQMGRHGSLIERDKYVTPRGIYDQMIVAQQAAEEDDVVSGVLETTEALAFTKMSVQCDDDDEENVWNQIVDDLKMGLKVRSIWKELFTVSQCYVATWWDIKNYDVKGRSKNGVKRKKKFPQLRVPSGMSLLDPLKIVPVGNFMFGQEKLAWIATRDEAMLYDNVLGGLEQDALVSRLFLGRYEPTQIEQARLGRLGLGPSNLYLLNPATVWRITSTRSEYKPFADVRLKSVFELLDMKNLLREMDRAHLLGATNFIVLIRKGTDHQPAKSAELAALQSSVRQLSQIPVIVGDHRLTIDIITPKVDLVLQPEKYNTIDARITARLYQMFMTGNFAAGAKGDDSIKLLRMVGRGLEARREVIREAIEEQILMQIFERNDLLTEEPTLEFHPKSIAIDFDPGLAVFLLDLLDRRQVSRGTVLNMIDLDEDDEARRLEKEKELYDDTFESLTPLQDPQQTQDFAKETLGLTQDNALETLDKTQKFTEKQADKQREFQAAHPPAPPVGARPAKKPAAKTTGTVKKKPANADPKSGGRSGGGNRSGGGAAPGSGQGQTKDPRRKADG